MNCSFLNNCYVPIDYIRNCILSEVDAALKAKLIKGDLDEYLKVSGLWLLIFNVLFSFACVQTIHTRLRATKDWVSLLPFISFMLGFLFFPSCHWSFPFWTYLQMRQLGSLFLTELKQTLLLPPGDAARAGTRYNVPLINSLVLYVGMQVCPCISFLFSIYAKLLWAIK